MAELARGNLRTAAQAPALVFGVAAAAAAVGFAVATGPRPVHVIAATLIGIAALLKPAWGLVGYLVLAATLPSSEGVSDSEIACFGLLGWLFIIATLKVLHSPPRHRYARWLTVAAYALSTLVLANLAVAWQHGISFKDWARDVAPLANLVMLVVLPAFITHEKDVRVVRMVFLGMAVFVATTNALRLGSALVPGLPRLWNPLMVGGTWVIALLVAAAAAGVSEVPKHSKPYLAMGLVGTVCAVLTPTRTVWIGVLAVVATSLLLSAKAGPQHLRRNALFLLCLAVTAGGLLLLWRASGTDSWTAQQERFETLGHIEEDQSVQIRKGQIREASSEFLRNPILGTGLGYQYSYRIGFTGDYEEGINYNHSDLANSLCKMGLVGTGALYTPLLLAMLLSGRLKRRAEAPRDRWFGAMAQIGLLVALVMGNSCPVLQERGTTFLLGLLVGLVVAISASVESQMAQRPGASTHP